MSRLKSFLPAAIGLIILIGLVLRLYHISDNQFLFYDEGMYIGYNRVFLNLVANNPAHNLTELGIILSLILKAALSTAKALWFLILNLRVFILGVHAWYFARWISAASGLATVVLLYFWSKRYFKSRRIAVISALILLILPSHVFYSRLGMQESLSTLLFLGAIYLYLFYERMRWQFVLSIFLLACVYLTNYRMIIGPVFIAFMEGFKTVSSAKKFNWPKVMVYFIGFYAVVLLVGSLYGGINNYVNFAWMSHQAKDAGGEFNLVNFLSYPYYTFALEGFFLACFFWANIYLVKFKKEQWKLLPFGLVLVQMAGFSLAAEKGARYLCVVLPFMAAAAAMMIDDIWQRWPKARRWTLTACGLGLATMLYLSTSLSLARTDYDKAVDLITDHDPQAVIVSTQPMIESLYMADEKRMVACPNSLYSLAALYKQGARYLILDPQAYITWTADGKRFSPPLIDFLQTTLQEVRPLAVFPHLNEILLTRFVLDHNEQIVDSLNFLSHASQEGYGKIRIYDLGSIFSDKIIAHDL